MSELQWTEVDGVTTIWTETPGPLRAGLLFRTGLADETLTTAGQTHLIEHMALSAVGGTERTSNAIVGPVATTFFTFGAPQDVSQFLAGVCSALGSLPGDRLESEKQVLAAELAARPYDYRSNLLTWRYGAKGFGLLGMAQLGIRRATLDELHEYASQRFTDGNAVLWLSGPPPIGLRLKLPRGPKQPPPPLVPVRDTFPSWFQDDACGGVAVGATLSRSFATSVYCEMAAVRLRRQLRSERALSYAPSVFYDPLNADTAHLVLFGDSDQEHRAELAKSFGEVFEGLGEVHDSEIETARGQLRELWAGSLTPPPAEKAVMEAQRAAMDWIHGKKFESLEWGATQLTEVTAGDVAAVGCEVRATAMFALPGQAALQPCFGKRALITTVPLVKGRKTVSLDVPIRLERLVYGPDGVSVIWSKDLHTTVRYAELAAALAYDDGCVCLIGSDATMLTVEPTLWRDGRHICFTIREQVPTPLLLDGFSRPANTIPKPTTTAWQRFRARLTQGYTPSPRPGNPASIVSHQPVPSPWRQPRFRTFVIVVMGFLLCALAFALLVSSCVLPGANC